MTLSPQITAGTPINFLQELVAFQAEDTESPSMFVLGQPTRKFVVAPNLQQLFKLDAVEQIERRRRAEEEEAERMRVKREEDEAKKAAALAAPTKKPVPSKPANSRPRGAGVNRGRGRGSATPAPSKKS